MNIGKMIAEAKVTALSRQEIEHRLCNTVYAHTHVLLLGKIKTAYDIAYTQPRVERVLEDKLVHAVYKTNADSLILVCE